MLNKKIMMLTIFLVSLLAIMAVSAEDNATSDVVSVEETSDDVVIVENNQFSSINEKNDYSGIDYNGTFTDLANDIANANGELNLTKNYVYSEDVEYINGIILDKQITIDGNGFIINGNGVAKIFNIKMDNVILKNIKFINAYSLSNGGALRLASSNSTIINCDFENCIANNYRGGAIYYDYYGNLINCNFENCYSGSGGAIYYDTFRENCDITNCTFNNIKSTFTHGGAIYSPNSRLNISNSVFLNCNSVERGGAIYCSGSQISLINSTFQKCFSNVYGGAIYFGDSSGSKNDNILFCNFINCSSERGGAIGCVGYNQVIKYCIFMNNTAKISGGAIHLAGRRFTVQFNYFIDSTSVLRNGIGYMDGFEKLVSYSNLFDYNWWGNNKGPNYNVFDSMKLRDTMGKKWLVLNIIYPKFSVNGSTGVISSKFVCYDDISKRYLPCDDFNFVRPVSYIIEGNQYYTVPGDFKYNINKYGSYNYTIKITVDNQKFEKIVNYVPDNYINTFSHLNDLIRECIANGNNTVLLDKNYTFDEILDSMLIISENNFIIDGNGYVINGNSQSVAFKITGTNVTLKNINFINCNDFLLKNFKLNNLNYSLHKGGSLCWEGLNGTLINCSFTDCSCNNDGGAIYWNGLNGKIINCSFTKNVAVHSNGGAIYLNNDNIIIKNSNFKNNQATSYIHDDKICGGQGGAVYGGKMMNCIFNYNKATFGGATAWSNNTNSIFIGNSADENGGGMYNGHAFNSTFTGNRAQEYGGGMYNGHAFNSTFTGNRAQEYGGAICGGSEEICVFKDNHRYDKLNKTWILSSFSDVKIYKQILVVSDYNQYLKYGDKLQVMFYTSNQIPISDVNITIDVYDVDHNHLGTYYVLSGNEWIINHVGNLELELSVKNSIYSVDKKKIYLNVNKLDSMINATIDDVIYSQNTIINIYSNVEGNVEVKIDKMNTKKDYIIANTNLSISFDNISAGIHMVSVVLIPKNSSYETSSFNANFEVSKKETFVQIKTINDVIYGENISVGIISSENGRAFVKIGNINKYMDIESNKEAFIDIGILDVGLYDIEVIFDGGDNYIKSFNNASFTVNPKNTFLIMNTKEYNNIERVMVDVMANESGKITMKLGNIVKSIDVMANKFSSVDFGILDVGLYNVEANFDAGNNYVSSNDSTIIKVLAKIDEKDINIITPEIKPNQENNIVINLPTDATGTVTLTIGDKTYTFNVKNGIANINVPKLNEGNYEYVIKYSGDNKYSSFENIGSINVAKPTPEIVIPPLDEPSEDGPVPIKLPSDATGTVTLVIDSKNYSFPVINGVANIYMPELNDGNYNYSITYSGDGKYSPFTTGGNLNIIAPKITAKNTAVQYSAKGKYSVTVYGADGKVASGVQVIFKISDKQAAKVKTNSKGVASYVVTKSPGKYKIQATALGKTVTKTLSVKHIVTLKTVALMKSAKKLTIQATLAKVNNKYLAKKTITFKINGKKVATAKTNKKGVAKITIKNPNVIKKLKVGKKATYQATYLKDTVKKIAKVKK